MFNEKEEVLKSKNEEIMDFHKQNAMLTGQLKEFEDLKEKHHELTQELQIHRPDALQKTDKIHELKQKGI
jgi:hypothetical protein